ncbi:MAG: glycine--tRNA ligase [bacterium]|nr:glycine--tRNA ligase [bacterium]
MDTVSDLMDKVVSLCKRRGFVYPNSEIYGGLANAYDYGPLGTELLRNIRNLWWETFVHRREDMYGLDGAIISNPKVWEASGHVTGFNDPLVDCRKCKQRQRADHLLEEVAHVDVVGKSLVELSRLIQENKIKCPSCGASDWTEVRKFNLLFKTSLGSVEGEKSAVYLRGETAQNMFINFANILRSFSPRVPFGMAQVGKAFRNEITPGNFIFRTLEFEQMEIEYFVREAEWEKHFDEWKKLMWQWLVDLGIKEAKLQWRRHSQEELSHYSKRTEDIEYNFPFGGFKELYGLAYRTDFDLKNHSQVSGQELLYTDPDTGEKFFPHVVEPTFGVTRTALVLLLDAFEEQTLDKGEVRTVLHLDPKIAPVKVAIFPLVANKPELWQKARDIYQSLKKDFVCAWDDIGNIGKRYRRQDEIGTPWCVTIDYQTLEDQTVTVRDRETMAQVRVAVVNLKDFFSEKLSW